MPNFPDRLYVHTPLTGDSSFDGYENYEDAEDGDIVAEYELKEVYRVKHVTKVTLQPEELNA